MLSGRRTGGCTTRTRVLRFRRAVGTSGAGLGSSVLGRSRWLASKGRTREQPNEYENDPSHYCYEDPYSNMSHLYEQPR